MTTTAKNSKLEIAATSDDLEDRPYKAATSAPDPFNLASLKINLDFKEGANAKKMLNVVPVRRPKKQEWIRVHQNETYRGNFAVIKLETDGEFFIVTPAIAREFAKECSHVTIYTVINSSGVVFLWPATIPAQEGYRNPWLTSAHEVAAAAMKRSVRMQSNRALGAYEYYYSDNPTPENDPVFPEESFNELLRIAFHKPGHFVDGVNHPVIRQLRGLS
jgi:hypothetical protein